MTQDKWQIDTISYKHTPLTNTHESFELDLQSISSHQQNGRQHI